MKIQEILFNKPIQIIQVFRSINVYGKDKKSYADRKEIMEWAEMESTTGHVIDGELYLPDSMLKDLDFKTCNLITIEDDNIRQVRVPGNHCMYADRVNKFEIFIIRKKEELLELYLNYGYFEVGIPARKNIKLCELKKNKPVEIRINGKTESSLSSRRQRTFKEQHYIFNYIGDFEKCRIFKTPYPPVIKTIPSKRKIVDMIKPLW